MNNRKRNIIAGIIIICLGMISAINNIIRGDMSDILLGIGFIIVGGIYLFKKDE